MAQLRELQEARQILEKSQLDDLLDVMEMYQDKGETYNPSEHGFVFSDSQIAESKTRRARERVIEDAYEHAA